MKNKTIIAVIGASLLALWGAVRGRLLGGGIVPLPDLLKKALEGLDCALLICAFAYLDAGSVFAYWQVAAAVFPAATILSNMGHADFYQMALGRNVIRDQTATPLVKAIVWGVYKIRGIDAPIDRGSLLYDATGMAVIGMMATLPVGIGVIYIGHWIVGTIIALSGLTNALAYYIGRHYLEGRFDTEGTAWGEWIRGFLRSLIRWGCFFFLWGVA